jgi:hypothetical protein
MTLNTMNNGFTAPEQHLDALTRAAEVLALGVAEEQLS